MFAPRRLLLVVLAGLAVLSAAAAPAGALPADRTYEMVSPLQKNGANIHNRSVNTAARIFHRASESGDAVAYFTQGVIFSGGSGSHWSQYVARRDPTIGWTTTGLNPPFSNRNGNPQTILYHWLSDDLSRGLVFTSGRLTSREDGPGNLYRQDTATLGVDLVTAPTINVPNDKLHQDPTGPAMADEVGAFAGASEDLNHVFFMDWRRLTADAPPEAPGNDASNLAMGERIYEWRAGQPLRLASVVPPGAPAPVGVGGHWSIGVSAGNPGDRTVSDDGSRLFFTAFPVVNGQAGALYVRIDGTQTIRVDKSEGPELEGSDTTFQAASADGRRALFVSPRRLTTSATAASSPQVCGFSTSLATQTNRCDLYLWTGDAAPGNRLTDLTTTDANGGGVNGVAGSSDDLTRVYFVARGNLVGGATGTDPKLYLWRAGVGLRLVTTLHPTGDHGIWDHGGTCAVGDRTPWICYRQTRVTPDGDRIAFISQAQLTAYPTAGRRQVYLYDASADELTCVSCSNLAASSEGDAAFQQLGTLPGGYQRVLPRNLSDDGQRVFFESTEALVPADQNGEVDVYVWQDGVVDLISSGMHDEPSWFTDASASGDDAFFVTRERLVPWADQDNLVDLYDARVGGGIPEVQRPIPCTGDLCQGPPSSAPPFVGAITEVFDAVEPAGARRTSFRVARPSTRAISKLARTGRLRLEVRANRRGRVQAVARARIGTRTRVVAGAKGPISRGRTTLSLTLSRAARRQLARNRQIVVGIVVRFSGVPEPREMSLRVRRSGS